MLRLDPRRSFVQLGHGAYQKRVWATVTSATADISVDVAGNKELTNRLLHEIGIPVPRADVVRSAGEAAEVARRIGYPVVLKPLDGNHGRGVMINLPDEAAVHEAFPAAERESRTAMSWWRRSSPARTTASWSSTIRWSPSPSGCRLTSSATAPHRGRAGGDHQSGSSPRHRTREDPDPHYRRRADRSRCWRSKSLALDDVPEEGRFVQLKLTGNMSTGGTSIDRTDDIHPDNVEIARQAAMVVGLDVAGIDFITADIARSVREQRGAIVEVNAGPGFRMHTHPTEGHPRHVGRAVIDMLFPPGSPSRVPIVAVTGTNGKTTTSRMIAHIMKTAGKKVGMTTTDGIYVDATQIAAGDMSGPASAQMVLKNPAIDYAVLETARGGILRSGLGFDRCDVAVVTNVSSDHLGLKGINTVAELARVKQVVPQSVLPGGASVLNADNSYTVEMARVARGEIIFFSMDEENPVVRDHLRERGKAVVLRPTRHGEMITLIEHRRDTSLLLAEEIPATMDGRIRVNIQNAMAAAAAAFAQDVQLEYIRNALRTFTSTFFQSPGRFNLLEIDGRKVLLDYCHNVAGLESMADFVKRMDADRTIAMIALPGDRSDDDITAFGRLAAGTFDEIVIREDYNPAAAAAAKSPICSRARSRPAGGAMARSTSSSTRSRRRGRRSHGPRATTW